MLDNIRLYDQNSIKINNIYFDPFHITDNNNDANIIFITHSHYDHFSPNDIEKIKNNDTKIVIPADCFLEISNLFSEKNIMVIEPNKEYNICNINFKTVPMYNKLSSFHPKENNWVGYLVNIDNITYYIVGDSDATEELINTKCDILFIPIGGKYTMDIDEAKEATIKIKPKFVVPVHYGTIIGDISDGLAFKNKLPNTISCVLKK